MDYNNLMKLTVALAQINTILGRPDANLEVHLNMVQQAQAGGADLLVFPELSLSGYVLQDLVPSVALHPTADDPIFRPLLEASQVIDLVVGFPEEDTRSRFYVSAAYLSKGRVLHVHRKIYLPTYGLFDEGRFFAPGDAIRAFDTPFGRAGILICEDSWHAAPPYLLWLDGADLLLVISASPGRGVSGEQVATARWVDAINAAYACLFTSFIVHVNRVGFEDGLHFWGGSAVHDPNGEVIGRGPYEEQALTLVELDLNQLHRTRARLPLLRDERTALVQRELSRILDKPRQTGD